MVALALAVGLSAPASAQLQPLELRSLRAQNDKPESSQTIRDKPNADRPPLRSPRDAAIDAQQRYGGRVLSVRLDQESYRVKLLKDGEVRVVRVPAR